MVSTLKDCGIQRRSTCLDQLSLPYDWKTPSDSSEGHTFGNDKPSKDQRVLLYGLTVELLRRRCGGREVVSLGTNSSILILRVFRSHSPLVRPLFRPTVGFHSESRPILRFDVRRSKGPTSLVLSPVSLSDTQT